jgi:heme/copper-type cytochrome/quinol oxidase subunit 2
VLHDGFFWATIVLSLIILGFFGVIVWCVRHFERERREDEARRRAAQATPKHGRLEVEVKWDSNEREVTLVYSTSVTHVQLQPAEARQLGSKIVEAADKASPPENDRPTSWERINED